MAEYSQVLAEQELGLKPSFLRETLADRTVIRGSLKRGYTVDWKCVHVHESAADARQCAREQLRSLWFASHGETVRKIPPADESRMTIALSKPGRATVLLAKDYKGWNKTDAVNRALDLLGQVLEAEREGIPVKIGEDRIRFLG